MTCVQIWLVEPGNRCANCPHWPECPDQTRCLHLVAGTGVSASTANADAARLGDFNFRNPLGVGLLRKVAQSGTQVILRNISSQRDDYVWVDVGGLD